MMTTGKRLLSKVTPYAKTLAGAAHPYRLAILYLLAHDPLWVKDLVNYLNLPENLVAHHLKLLGSSGWVEKSKEGRHTAYRLSEKAFRELPKLLWETPWGKRLGGL